MLTLNHDWRLVTYAKESIQQLRVEQVRDLGPGPIKAKIGETERARVHAMLVLGGRDLDAGNVSVRLHSKGSKAPSRDGSGEADYCEV